MTRKILDTFEAVKRPVSITFVLDTSGSMAGAPLQQAKAGARVFLEALPAGDSARLLLFSAKPRWIAERPEPLAKSRASLIGSVESSFAEGGTALYDAIIAACRPAPGEPKGGARAVIVLTDGQDTDSTVKLEAVLSQLQKQASGEGGSDAAFARLFTIAYGEKADAAVLKQLAEAGGGGFFSGTPKDIQSVYAELATFF